MIVNGRKQLRPAPFLNAPQPEASHTEAKVHTCPPAVGYALRNSAREAAKHRLHTPAVIKPHMTDVGPPLGKARDSEAESAVQEFKMAKAKPSMDNGLKLRRSSCLTPSAARWASSARTLCLPPVDDFLGAISSSRALVPRPYCSEDVDCARSSSAVSHGLSPAATKLYVLRARGPPPRGPRAPMSRRLLTRHVVQYLRRPLRMIPVTTSSPGLRV
ncbi:hypothetical protein LTR29_012953 [Friedmanniomyces endolithicus]|nr:hypothetical protein LTR29_012953 [Friedmanniomyces endolithicus]